MASKLKKQFFISLLISAIAASFILMLSQQGFFNRLELSAMDLAFRLRAEVPKNHNIVIIEVSDADILDIGRWPWGRSWHAAMAKALYDLGAKEVYFDTVFSEPSTEEDDKLFENAMKVTKNIYLPFVYQTNVFEEDMTLKPLARFSAYMKGTGATNVLTDVDGIIRKVPLVFISKNGICQPHMFLRLAMDYSGFRIEKVAKDYLILSNKKERIKIPMLEGNQILVNWSKKWKESFVHYSFLDVLAGYKDFSEHKKPASLRLEDFKDSICLIGITAMGLYDIKPVPIEPQYPGIGIMAAVINTVLSKEFMRVSPVWVNFIILYLLAFLPALLIHGEKPLRETVFIFMIGVLYWVVYFALFNQGVILQFVMPIIGFFLSYLGVETYNFIYVSVERQRFFKMSVTDSLTGLYNMLYFKVVLNEEMTHGKISKVFFSVVMIDIDNFKNFNDKYGHLVGDLVLKSVANTIKSSVRSMDVVARYGGEEMIVLLRWATFKDGMAIAEKIMKNIREHIVRDKDDNYGVTISVGVSTYKNGDTIDSIIKRADEGLYTAKALGKDRVCSIEP